MTHARPLPSVRPSSSGAFEDDVVPSISIADVDVFAPFSETEGMPDNDLRRLGDRAKTNESSPSLPSVFRG